ncbi:extracellular matrix protein 1 [Puntigrus tetrazona]|uniref:extracellular matrix protein 1 n=1 Tax=Puntigrus tetrazona TaxID=1606681 RepID=UPI001C88E411|nr:extracellular matrix protein 1 [Puntigrus tetrazona]
MVWKSALAALILHLISLSGGQIIDPNLLIETSFPPARPSYNNLNAACLYGNGRPRHPAFCFPMNSYAYTQRAGKAVNRIESWLGQCCYAGLAFGARQILCCAKQAWKTALSYFCIEEYSTMTLVHECCEKKGEERWKCFEKRAPNPSYQPVCGYIAPPIPPDDIFTWDPKTC